MAELIRYLLQDFTLTMLGLRLAVSSIALFCAPRPLTAKHAVRAFLSYCILFTVSISYLHNFIVHVFFREWTARFIGWPDSPVQAEVGYDQACQQAHFELVKRVPRLREKMATGCIPAGRGPKQP